MNDFHFTQLDPDDLAAKVAEIVLKRLEPRLQALEQAIEEREPGEYLKQGEVQRRFSIGKDLLGKIVKAGFIERYDGGSHGLYRADEIERYLRRYHVNGRKSEKVNGKHY